MEPLSARSHPGHRARLKQCSKVCFPSYDRNSGFLYDLTSVEVSELDDIVWFIGGSVCKWFGSC